MFQCDTSPELSKTGKATPTVPVVYVFGVTRESKAVIAERELVGIGYVGWMDGGV